MASAVHPHVRGEYDGADGGKDFLVGSSPRAWGIQGNKVSFLVSDRFIPTCVGNTLHHKRSKRRRTVHPHVRGEYLPSLTATAGAGGSSPRAWGIRNAFKSSFVD